MHQQTVTTSSSYHIVLCASDLFQCKYNASIYIIWSFVMFSFWLKDCIIFHAITGGTSVECITKQHGMRIKLRKLSYSILHRQQPLLWRYYTKHCCVLCSINNIHFDESLLISTHTNNYGTHTHTHSVYHNLLFLFFIFGYSTMSSIHNLIKASCACAPHIASCCMHSCSHTKNSKHLQ